MGAAGASWDRRGTPRAAAHAGVNVCASSTIGWSLCIDEGLYACVSPFWNSIFRFPSGRISMTTPAPWMSCLNFIPSVNVSARAICFSIRLASVACLFSCIVAFARMVSESGCS